MYAIIKSGGKQYKVAKGDVIDVELIDADIGAQINFDDILLFNDGSNANVGTPNLANFFVQGELLDIVHGPKITSMKYKPSHHQYRKFGHRQMYSRVKITELGSSTKNKGE